MMYNYYSVYHQDKMTTDSNLLHLIYKNEDCTQYLIRCQILVQTMHYYDLWLNSNQSCAEFAQHCKSTNYQL